MTKSLETTVGVLGGVGLVLAGLAIFVWDAGKLQQVRNSRDWPQVEGIVVRSRIDDSRREKKPLVQYTYTVAGTAYSSRQISFDLFDAPGGQGRLESILSRYPAGQQVTVYYDPTKPETAVVEPGVYSPFLMPLVFGAIFFLGGLWGLWKSASQFWNTENVRPGNGASRRQIVSTVAVSALVYITCSLTLLDSAVQETLIKAFGARPFGVPNLILVVALQTLLFVPMPYVFWHWMKVTFQALQDGESIGVGYLLKVGRLHPDLRRSRSVCLGGLLYFLAITGAWIVYASNRGI